VRFVEVMVPRSSMHLVGGSVGIPAERDAWPNRSQEVVMHFSVSIPTNKEGLNMPLPFADEQDLVRIVKEAERLGFHSVWGNDHITAPRYVRDEFKKPPRFYELLVTLSYLAGVTSKVKLGTCVIVLPMREPVYLAKQVATLDHFSGGRVLFGCQSEYYVVPFAEGNVAKIPDSVTDEQALFATDSTAANTCRGAVWCTMCPAPGTSRS